MDDPELESDEVADERVKKKKKRESLKNGGGSNIFSNPVDG